MENVYDRIYELMDRHTDGCYAVAGIVLWQKKG